MRCPCGHSDLQNSVSQFFVGGCAGLACSSAPGHSCGTRSWLQKKRNANLFLTTTVYNSSKPLNNVRMSENGGWKKGGHFMAGLAVLAVCSEFILKSLGSMLIILGCFSGCERFFSNDKCPHSSSALPKHDCHKMIISLISLAFSTKLCSQEG